MLKVGKMTDEKRKVINDILELFTPKMGDSGYRIGHSGPERPLKLWSPRKPSGDLTFVLFKGVLLKRFFGISEIGIITKESNYACYTQDIADFPFEDLIMLHSWSIKYFSKNKNTD